ncbi:M23 family metallopeptidase [Nitrospina watsonii]|uniref:Peptidase_M23 domain-containing protein n=1 Tax=Nitrospina watsonii TaxID=1323948 RepID=A0ABM9HAY7_9BACT|nr:M23 family metallopeptidase [Nitrospina watsonii]CAI2717334.1 Peptidase_M23 domain-containing protein [Nitrospina watsonii]
MDFEPPKESAVLREQDWPQKKKGASPFWVVLYTLVGVGTFFFYNQDTDLVRDLTGMVPEKPVQQLVEATPLAPAVDWVGQQAKDLPAEGDWIVGHTGSFDPGVEPGPAPHLQKTAYDPAALERRTLHALGLEVHNSLTHSLCARLPADECKRLSAYTARILAWYMDVSHSVRKGDRLSLIYEEIDGEERFRILKLKYDSGFLKQVIEANFYQAPNMPYGSYFDTSGRELFPRLSERTAPIRRYEAITSLPGDYRRGKVDGHHGTDFKAEVGTPVYASFHGRITRTNWNRSHNGYCIEIVHPREGVRTLYLHLDQVMVRRGEYVKRGQQIGTSGNTGRSFAPHLHYEVRRLGGNDRIHNPFKFKHHATHVRRIPAQALDDFKQRVRHYDALLKGEPFMQADAVSRKKANS